MESLSIRYLVDNDLPELIELYNEYEKSIPPLLKKHEVKDKWIEIQNDKKRKYYVGEIDISISETSSLLRADPPLCSASVL